MATYRVTQRHKPDRDYGTALAAAGAYTTAVKRPDLLQAVEDELRLSAVGDGVASVIGVEAWRLT